MYRVALGADLPITEVPGITGDSAARLIDKLDRQRCNATNAVLSETCDWRAGAVYADLARHIRGPARTIHRQRDRIQSRATKNMNRVGFRTGCSIPKAPSDTVDTAGRLIDESHRQWNLPTGDVLCERGNWTWDRLSRRRNRRADAILDGDVAHNSLFDAPITQIHAQAELIARVLHANGVPDTQQTVQNG